MLLLKNTIVLKSHLNDRNTLSEQWAHRERKAKQKRSANERWTQDERFIRSTSEVILTLDLIDKQEKQINKLHVFFVISPSIGLSLLYLLKFNSFNKKKNYLKFQTVLTDLPDIYSVHISSPVKIFYVLCVLCFEVKKNCYENLRFMNNCDM